MILQFNPILDFVILFISLIGILSVIVVFILLQTISSKVLELQTNSAVLFSAKEDSDGQKIRYNDRIVIRKSEPYVWQVNRFKYVRLFVVRQGEEVTTDFPQRYISELTEKGIRKIIIDGLEKERPAKEIAKEVLELRVKDEDVKEDWNTIFESEAIKQSVAGMLMSRKMSLITLAAGGFIGVMIVLILQYLSQFV
jgi:hypothetical protein